MRIGVFGGTFDPVHYGHLILAEQAREQAELDQVWFVPSARPPHKDPRDITPIDRRVEMLGLALAGQETKFRVEPLERDRPGPSYTADTLDALHSVYPEHEFHLILGADAVRDLPGWYEPRRIVARAGLIVAARPGHEAWGAGPLAVALGLREADVRVRRIEMPLIEIASRDLRQRARDGRSLLFQLPRAVETYAREKRLYQAQ